MAEGIRTNTPNVPLQNVRTNKETSYCLLSRAKFKETGGEEQDITKAERQDIESHFREIRCRTKINVRCKDRNSAFTKPHDFYIVDQCPQNLDAVCSLELYEKIKAPGHEVVQPLPLRFEEPTRGANFFKLAAP